MKEANITPADKEALARLVRAAWSSSVVTASRVDDIFRNVTSRAKFIEKWVRRKRTGSRVIHDSSAPPCIFQIGSEIVRNPIVLSMCSGCLFHDTKCTLNIKPTSSMISRVSGASNGVGPSPLNILSTNVSGSKVG